MIQKEKREIAYQNKDVLSKILAENFKEKSLKVYGVKVPRIKEVLPTNLPAIQVNEMRLDNLFLLEDGSLAVIDYESEVKRSNQLKYVNYIVRVLERYKKNGMPKNIRMIVIYTADVKTAPKRFSAGCLTLRMERAFLGKMNPEAMSKQIRVKLENKEPLSEEEQMKLIILPLAYKGKERKRRAVKEAVELAKQIPGDEERTFALSGILVFADKIIDDETAEYVKEVLRMTKVAQLLMEEGRQDGWKKGQQDGWRKGQQDERREGIKALINSLKSFSIPDEMIVNQLMEQYRLNKDDARALLK